MVDKIVILVVQIIVAILLYTTNNMLTDILVVVGAGVYCLTIVTVPLALVSATEEFDKRFTRLYDALHLAPYIVSLLVLVAFLDHVTHVWIQYVAVVATVISTLVNIRGCLSWLKRSI